MAPGSDDVSQDLSNDPPRGIRRVAGDKEARSLWSGRPQRAAAKGDDGAVAHVEILRYLEDPDIV